MQENINIPDSTITSALTFRNLVLMNMQQLTNFPYIEKDFDALTDYELLCLVVKYLNDVIANQNEQNDSITSMYESFLALQTYVNNTKDTLEDAFNTLDDYVRNYFANLDVQDEINNKLDQMLEDGVLEQIIEQFLQSTAIWCFNTVADMKSATNLVNGSTARTLGYYSISDGGGALYHITDTESLTDFQEELSSNLYATLLINDEVNVKQLGAYGDDTHDDTTIIRNAIKKLHDNEGQSGWRRAKTLYFPKGTYLVSSSLIDSTLDVGGLSITFKGSGKHTSTIKSSTSTLFDNNQIFGFVCFDNLRFEGDNTNLFMNYVGGGSGNAQNMRFNQCSFAYFKTIINASGTTMTSENTFFECSISGCGSDELPCELFIFNNSQSVNWRFYATDIESFIGVLFKYLRGANVTWYQGSCIPLRNSILIDGRTADPNYFGQGNSPYLIMNQVRIEMRENSCLLQKGNSLASLYLVFNECGMGGQNIPTSPTVKTINLGDGNNRLFFNHCTNFEKYSFSSSTRLSAMSYNSDDVNFNDCTFLPNDNIQQILSRSDFQYTGTSTGYLPSIKVNGIKYRILSTAQQFASGDKIQEVILQQIGDPGGILVRPADPSSTYERNYYINGYIKSINVVGIAKPAYGGTAKFDLKFYDENDTLLGEVNDLINKNNNETVFVGKYVNNLKMVSTSDYSGSVQVTKIIIVSVERI